METHLQLALAGTRVLADIITLAGGLDEVTPTYRRKPGLARVAVNFECNIHGGYNRIPGYERTDGRPKPSDGVYSILATTITGTFSVGNTITGGTLAATAVVLAVVTTVSPNYLVITKIVGTFLSGEALKVAAVTQGTASDVAIAGGASSTLLDATYKNLAADSYRDDIAAIPGSGKVRGIVEHNDVKYGFRDNAGITACAIYKSSTAGWVAVPTGEEVSFTLGGATAPADGATLTQGGVTATIKRVVATTASTTWATNTAAGRFVIYSRAGGNYAAGAATIGGVNVTLSGIQTAITILPGGRYEFKKENFGGAVNTLRVYGADGVNRGFEFDGSDYSYVPITTGMTADTPLHVWAHKKQLFFSFLGSVQHAAPGTPYIWSAVLGASELAMGDTVTGFAEQPGSASGAALSIFTRNRLSTLYGSGVADWQLVPYREELGAYAYTVQDMGQATFLDDRGVTQITTSQVYGNFAHNAMTNQILDTMNTLRLLAVSSCISRDRSQYRLFFTSGYAIYITMVGNKVVGIMPMLFPDIPWVVYSGEAVNGAENIYFGSDDGYVYQMDLGTSFDGDAIEFYLNLAYNFQGAPRVNKRYRDCTLEVSGNGYAAFSFGYTLGYGSTDIPQPDTVSLSSSFSSVFWDAFTWDAFIWDGTTLEPNNTDMDGEAENVSLAITGSSDIYAEFTISSMLVHYTQRGRLRP